MTEIKGFRAPRLNVCITRPRLLATVGLLTLCSALPVVQAQTSDQTTKELQDLPPLPDYPNPITMENQVQYFELWRDDKRPWKGTNSSTNYWHRWLTQEFKVNPKLTWDQGALKFMTDNSNESSVFLMASVFDNISSALVQGFTGSQGIYFKGPMGKVKEIHLTTTKYKPDTQDFGHNKGWFFSFNKSTGVLTTAMTTTSNGYGDLGSGGDLVSWITKNVK